MTWLIVALVAYFLNAIAMVIDKTLLKKGGIESPVVYTFYIAALGSVLMLFVIPFGFSVPAPFVVLVSLIAGAVFVWALILQFKALAKDDATRVISSIGGLVPVFVFILAWFVLEENFSRYEFCGGILLVAGSFLISLDFHERGGAWTWLKKKMGYTKFALPHIRQTLWLALPSALLYAISSILTKFVYNNTTFLNGFIWTRLGSLLAVLSLLLIAKNRHDIKSSLQKGKQNNSNQKNQRFRFLFGQACGGSSALLQQYAIFLGSVVLVNALQGTQYAFVFVLVIILTLFAPKLLKEKITQEIVIQKIISIILIAVGLYLVTV